MWDEMQSRQIRWVTFSHKTNTLNPVPCVYALYDLDGILVYIGQTQNIQQRFKVHRRRQLAFAKATVVFDRKYRMRLKRRLISRLQPSRNRIYTGIYRPLDSRPMMRPTGIYW